MTWKLVLSGGPLIVLLTLFGIVCGGVEVKVQPTQCCSAPELFITINCTGEDMSLKCPHGRYMLEADDEFDAFKLLNDGRLHMLNDDVILEKDEYCFGRMPIDNSTVEWHEATFVCFEEAIANGMEFIIKGILSIISIIFLCFTLYIYWILPRLNETQDKVTCYALGCITMLFVFLAMIQLIKPNILMEAGVCTIFGFGLYFFTISYFSWLNVIMANIWKNSLTRHWSFSESKWYAGCHIYAWTVPSILFILVQKAHHTKGGLEPAIGMHSCWFADPLETRIYTYAPISVSIAINIVLLLIICWNLHKNGDNISPNKKRAHRFKCILYTKLFFLAGVTWIFEILSHFFDDSSGKVHWLITDFINGIHGVLIFVVLVVWRNKIRKQLAGQTFCCFKLPQHWEQVEDEEEEQLHEEEGREMVPK